MCGNTLRHQGQTCHAGNICQRVAYAARPFAASKVFVPMLPDNLSSPEHTNGSPISNELLPFLVVFKLAAVCLECLQVQAACWLVQHWTKVYLAGPCFRQQQL